MKSFIQSYYTERFIKLLEKNIVHKKLEKLNQHLLKINIQKTYKNQKIGMFLLFLHSQNPILNQKSIDWILKNQIFHINQQEKIELICKYKEKKECISEKYWNQIIESIDMKEIIDQKNFLVHIIIENNLKFFFNQQLKSIIKNSDCNFLYLNKYLPISCFLKENESFNFKEDCLEEIIKKTNFHEKEVFINFLILVVTKEVQLEESIFKKILQYVPKQIQEDTVQYFLKEQYKFCDSYQDDFISNKEYELFIKRLLEKNMVSISSIEKELNHQFPTLLSELKKQEIEKLKNHLNQNLNQEKKEDKKLKL